MQSASPILLITLISAIYGRKVVPPHGNFDYNPRIWLSEYIELDSFVGLSADHQFRTQQEYENDFISKNGSDYIVYDDTYALVFWCRAKYPVTWTVPFPEQLEDMISYRIQTVEHRASVLRSKFGNIVNRAYSSLLILVDPWTSTFFSVNFTCKSVDSKRSGSQSSIHLFGRGSQTIEKEGETIHVSVSPHIDPLEEGYYILPCRPALPDMPVILEKQVVIDEDHTSWKEIRSSEKYMSFNPKVGFTLDKRLFGSQLFGLYRCRVLENEYADDETKEGGKNNNNDDDDDGHIVYVKVQKSYSNLSDPKGLQEFRGVSRITGNARVEFVESLDFDFLQCCTGVPKKEPELYVEHCNSPGECGIWKAIYMKSIETSGTPSHRYASPNDNVENRTDCVQHYLYSGSGLIYCKGDNVEYFSLYFDALKKDSRAGNGTVQTNGHYHGWSDIFHYEMEVNDSSTPLSLSQKARLIVGYRKELKNNSHEYDIYETFPGGILLRGSDSPKLDKVLHSQLGMEQKEGLEVVKYDRDIYFEGEKMMFICLAHKLFYAHGSYLRLNWRNASTARTLQPIYGADILVKMKDNLEIRHKLGSETFISLVSEEIRADLNMKSVECLIPQWNTTAWDTITYEITVRPSFLPKFEGGAEEEIVYFTLNETNQKIEFKILESIPRAKVSVSKDGKLLNLGENDSGGFNYVLKLEHNEEYGDDDLMNGNITDSSNKVELTFLQVTHEVQGVYECAAENVKGRVTKRIKVIVTEQKTAALAIVGSCVCVLGILFVGIGIWYKCQHKEIRMLRFGISRL